jgi:hypothetical protein
MSFPYENALQVEVTGGQSNCVELLAPPRGSVKKLIIQQVSGTVAGFTADLYNREGACGDEPEVSSSFDDVPSITPALHRVMPQVVAGAGGSAQFGLDYNYVNMDEQDIRRTPNSRLWLDLAPGGTGAKTFQISYTIEPWEG